MAEPTTATEIANEMCAAIEEMNFPQSQSFIEAKDRAGRAAALWRELTAQLQAERNGDQ